MDEDASLEMAIGIADLDKEVAAYTTAVQTRLDSGLPIPAMDAEALLTLALLLIKCQNGIVHTLYEFWATVGDSIQKNNT